MDSVTCAGIKVEGRLVVLEVSGYQLAARDVGDLITAKIVAVTPLAPEPE